MMIDEVLRSEGLSAAKARRGLKDGSLVAVRNSRREIRPLLIGAGVSTKVNANIGTSTEREDLQEELLKAKVAVDSGADALMDLSVEGNAKDLRRILMREFPIALGTVPIYQVYSRKKINFTLEDFLSELEGQCRQGVDFVTIHSGITQKSVKYARKRLIPVTSRGGCFLVAWMRKNKDENPLYTGYDQILEVLREYDVTISLGDALRPACLHDATDKAQLEELKTLGALTKRAWKAGVKVIVEGPGHVPLDQIEYNMKIQKKLCHNAPFYVLGPLVTDIALGYDHITSAIGGAIAGMHGADFLCYVTPSEHLGLPTIEDVKQGVVASKIAAHAADIVKLKRRDRDDELSLARKNLDWAKMFELSIDKTIKYKYPHLEGKKECTMCGKYCALKIGGDI